MNDTLLQALNDQLREEAQSSWIYLSMAAWLESHHFPGFARWMRVQAKEEGQHFLKFLDFLLDRGEQPVLPAIAQPKAQWGSVLEVFEETLAHERHITSTIHRLMDLAQEKRDHATVAFLTWFVTEQVEEEKHADEWLQKLRMAGESKGSLLHLDHQAGKRE